MSREAVIRRLEAGFDDGGFLAELARRVAIPTESQIPESHPHLERYLTEEIGPALEVMGYVVRVVPNTVPTGGPFLIGRRFEGEGLPTVMTYGHGDVVRGLAGQWRDGRDPWTLEVDGERVYGRGVVDNKGQHTINMWALAAVLAQRGRLGFNSIFLMETSEEVGSTGVYEMTRACREELSGDVLIASDGPRVARERPTLWLGNRGALNFDLAVRLREGGHHSGNWGGLLANPAVILANAISSIIDRNGRVRCRELVPESMPDSVRRALLGIEVDPGAGGPRIDVDYGEPGLTPAERVYGWNTFDVLSFDCGNPDNPVNAVPPQAVATCQIRYTVDRPRETLLPALRAFLDTAGFPEVTITERSFYGASRLDPGHPWVQWACDSIERTLGERPAILPNVGASLPNDAFVDTLGLATIYVPHSYPGCSQHAPNEHGLLPLFREGLAMMGGLYWDMGDDPAPFRGDGGRDDDRA